MMYLYTAIIVIYFTISLIITLNYIYTILYINNCIIHLLSTLFKYQLTLQRCEKVGRLYFRSIILLKKKRKEK